MTHQEKDALLNRIYALPTEWADAGGSYGPGGPVGSKDAAMLWPEDVIDAINQFAEDNNAPVKQPDPDTGLMPCKCGGEAGLHYSVMMRDNDCYAECGVCGKHSKVALCEEKARDAWNAAMRGSQPDPDTGLVPCGCGGQGLFEGAYLDEEVPSSYRVCLSCSECGMSTAEYGYEQEAMRAWNTAMGWKGDADDGRTIS